MKQHTKLLSPVGTAYNSIVRKRYVVDAPDDSKGLKVRHFFIFALVITLCLSMCSCGSQKTVTQLVEHTSVDTVYLNKFLYDSIYIEKELTKEYHRARPEYIEGKPLNRLNPSETDTLFIKDVSVEFRYRKLTDTLRIVQRDSIPYEVTITEVKEIHRPLTLFDKLCRACFWFLTTCLTLYIAHRLRK